MQFLGIPSRQDDSWTNLNPNNNNNFDKNFDDNRNNDERDDTRDGPREEVLPFEDSFDLDLKPLGRASL